MTLAFERAGPILGLRGSDCGPIRRRSGLSEALIEGRLIGKILFWKTLYPRNFKARPERSRGAPKTRQDESGSKLRVELMRSSGRNRPRM